MRLNGKASHATPLIREICGRIANAPEQSLPFHDYMELCLYHPAYGYYSRSESKIGKQGDFYTSSAIGTVMGDMLGDCIAEWSRGLPSPADAIPVVEWGGGSGRLAGHILDRLRRNHPACYERLNYTLIDFSGYHRRTQAEMLQAHRDKVNLCGGEEWLENGRRDAFVFSNELLDAFPVHRVCFKEGALHEAYVGWEAEEQRFYEIWKPSQNAALAGYLRRWNVNLAEGQMAEINLRADQWIGQIGRRLTSGLLMTIDYGDTAEEIYANHRMLGTLMCYRKHRAHDDPYRFAGEQDITSHVNFSACIAAGEAVGFRDWTYRTQREFLVDCGILNELQDDAQGDPFGPVARKNRSIRQILWSDRMSELFKVLIQRKG